MDFAQNLFFFGIVAILTGLVFLALGYWELKRKGKKSHQ